MWKAGVENSGKQCHGRKRRAENKMYCDECAWFLDMSAGHFGAETKSQQDTCDVPSEPCSHVLAGQWF